MCIVFWGFCLSFSGVFSFLLVFFFFLFSPTTVEPLTKDHVDSWEKPKQKHSQRRDGPCWGVHCGNMERAVLRKLGLRRLEVGGGVFHQGSTAHLIWFLHQFFAFTQCFILTFFFFFFNEVLICFFFVCWVLFLFFGVFFNIYSLLLNSFEIYFSVSYAVMRKTSKQSCV